MRIEKKQYLIVLVLAIVVAAMGLTWMSKPAEPVLQSADVSPTPMRTPNPVSSATPPLPRVPPVPASIANVDQALSVQVERLLATRDAGSAYAAYFLVSACTTFNRHHDMKLYDDKLRVQRDMTSSERQHMTKMCSGMTERERMARLDYLATAVKGGVDGAAWTFATEGPFGDLSALKTRPDDPLVQAWKTTATTQLSKAAEDGDLMVLLVWGLQLLSGSDLAEKNPMLGFSYLAAFGFVQSDRMGPNDPGAQAYKDGSQMMNAFAGSLTAEQRSAAVAAGRGIADKLKLRTKGI
jgi:hypothetical protein